MSYDLICICDYEYFTKGKLYKIEKINYNESGNVYVVKNDKGKYNNFFDLTIVFKKLGA